MWLRWALKHIGKSMFRWDFFAGFRNIRPDKSRNLLGHSQALARKKYISSVFCTLQRWWICFLSRFFLPSFWALAEKKSSSRFFHALDHGLVVHRLVSCMYFVLCLLMIHWYKNELAYLSAKHFTPPLRRQQFNAYRPVGTENWNNLHSAMVWRVAPFCTYSRW